MASGRSSTSSFTAPCRSELTSRVVFGPGHCFLMLVLPPLAMIGRDGGEGGRPLNLERRQSHRAKQGTRLRITPAAAERRRIEEPERGVSSRGGRLLILEQSGLDNSVRPELDIRALQYSGPRCWSSGASDVARVPAR